MLNQRIQAQQIIPFNMEKSYGITLITLLILKRSKHKINEFNKDPAGGIVTRHKVFINV